MTAAATAQNGHRVRVHYTGRLDDGAVFDSSQGGTPLAFTIGDGQVIPGFESAIVGMASERRRRCGLPAPTPTASASRTA